jgi:hypothetical protein
MAKPFSENERYDSLIRRRIKFVTEKGSMARLFPKGTNHILQEELFRLLKPSDLAQIQTREEYDNWLVQIVELDCWEKYSRHGLDIERWAYFTKLINIIVYEIVSNRDLVSEVDWKRIQPFLHVPIDKIVMNHLAKIDSNFPSLDDLEGDLKGMTKEKYWQIQDGIRKLAKTYRVPPIWFEAAWSA